MAAAEWIALIVVFFITSIVSVVTGSTSLITVPVMLQFGIDPRTALATNMLALLFMSTGGALPFARTNTIDRRRLPVLIVLTLVGSVIGALLVVVIPPKAIPLIISISMIAVALFSISNRNAGVSEAVGEPTQGAEVAGSVATLALGIYGGFFSGGYVTLLTAAYVALFGMTFLQAVAITKVINVFSSLVAVLIFWWQGLIDFRLGAALGIAAFIGSLIGARIAMRINNEWLRRIFIGAVIILAFKTILFDLWR
jgi:uncharacterized protein